MRRLSENGTIGREVAMCSTLADRFPSTNWRAKLGSGDWPQSPQAVQVNRPYQFAAEDSGHYNC
jgi:hypothetical protein